MAKSFEQYREAGCTLFAAGTDFDRAIYVVAVGQDGNPCIGCYKASEYCAARNKLAANRPVQITSETVRQEAERRNVSISQVRRERRANNQQ